MTTNTLRFTVRGQPVAWSRPRISRHGGLYNLRELTEWEEQVAQAATIAAKKQGWTMPQSHEAVAITTTFYLRLPQSTPKRNLEVLVHSAAISRGDGSNFLKAIEDGLTDRVEHGLIVRHGVIHDDRQLCDGTYHKRWAAPGQERAEVTVTAP